MLQVTVLDFYKANSTANTTVFLTTIIKDNVAESIEILKSVFASVSEMSDPQEKIQQLNIISKEFNSLDYELTINATIIDECSCSNHGEGNEDQVCQCDSDYTKLADCSISDDEYDDIITLKLNMLNSIEELGEDANR